MNKRFSNRTNMTTKRNRLTEAINDSFPDWLKKEIDGSKGLARRLSNAGVDLTNATFTPSYLPKNDREGKVAVYLIRAEYGVHTLYIPGIQDATVYINGRYRDCSKLGTKLLSDVTIDSGYIDMTDSTNTNTELRAERAKAKEGSIERGAGQHRQKNYHTGEINWITAYGEDKSGYKLDPDRLIRKLQSMNQDGFASEIEKIYKRIENCRAEIVDIISNVDL